MTHSEIRRFGKLIKALAEIKHPLTEVTINTFSNPDSDCSVEKLLNTFEKELASILSNKNQH